MQFKATIGDSGLMDVSAPDFATAESFVRSEAKGERFMVQTLDGQSFTIEPSKATMDQIYADIEAGKLCRVCQFHAPLNPVYASLCRKCMAEEYN